MSFLRIKTIKGKSYLYRQTSVRKGRKVLSIMEYLGALVAIGVAAASPGRPGGFSGSKPTDKRQIRDQEAHDREKFHTNRAAFNVKQRQDYERQNKGKVKAEPVETAKDREIMEAVREFNEARAAEKAEIAGDKSQTYDAPDV
jgi:hypothetical protein